jgi:hypothetical protein
MENNNCIIFINSKLSKEQIINDLENNFSNELKTIDLFIDNNEDFENGDLRSFPDGFLYFKYYLEVESNNNIQQFISSLLNYLWQKDISAVASCDFENSLPEKGGYNSKNIPWAK